MAVSYDENVIQTFADRLYAQAAGIVATHTILGALLVPIERNTRRGGSSRAAACPQ